MTSASTSGWIADGRVAVTAADLMGGRVAVHVRPSAASSPGTHLAADRMADVVLSRIGAWADRITRFDPESELSRLNADGAEAVSIGPTLTQVLDWGRRAEVLSDGIVDISLLDARLAAEAGSEGPVEPVDAGPIPAADSWSLTRRARGAVLHRPVGIRFDLDGVGKGWLADRALALLLRLVPRASAVVDADGDVALRVDPDDPEGWALGIADPRAPGDLLAVLQFGAGSTDAAGFGVATSGTSVHRWGSDGRIAHHLIDPRTRRPAETDVVQATAIGRTAREAEAYAKTAVIVGSEVALRRLDQPDVLGLVLLTEHGRLLATPRTMAYLG